jgi:hypothetical protein
MILVENIPCQQLDFCGRFSAFILLRPLLLSARPSFSDGKGFVPSAKFAGYFPVWATEGPVLQKEFNGGSIVFIGRISICSHFK